MLIASSDILAERIYDDVYAGNDQKSIAKAQKCLKVCEHFSTRSRMNLQGRSDLGFTSESNMEKKKKLWVYGRAQHKLCS